MKSIRAGPCGGPGNRAKASASCPSSLASTPAPAGRMSSSTAWKHPLLIAARASRGLSLSQSFANDDEDEEVEMDENDEEKEVELPRKTQEEFMARLVPSVMARVVLGRGGKVRPGRGQKGMARRHRLVLKDKIHGISKPDIRRLARRGGVKRISGNIYNTIRNALKRKLTSILQEAILRAEYAKRKTITITDILHSLARQGRPMYGFDPETYSYQAVSRIPVPRMN